MPIDANGNYIPVTQAAKGARIPIGSTVDSRGRVTKPNVPLVQRQVPSEADLAGLDWGVAGGGTGATQGANAPIPINRPALYFTGDEFSQLPDNSQDRYALQQAMVMANLLNPNELGAWGAASDKAFTYLLALSNAGGTDWHTTLNTKIAAGAEYDKAQAAAKRAAAIPPLQVKLSNPDDLRSAAQNVARTLQGGDLPEADLQRFVQSYQDSERQAAATEHQQMYGNYAQTGQLGSTEVTAPASPDVAAEKQIRAEHPGQVMVTDFGKALDTAVKAFTTSVVPGR